MEGGTITATVTGRRRYCDLAQGGHREFTDRASNKITRHINNTDFNDANWIKRVIKILASITRPTVWGAICIKIIKNRTIYNYCIFINTAIFLTHKYCYGYINTAKDLYILLRYIKDLYMLLGIYKYC